MPDTKLPSLRILPIAGIAIGILAALLLLLATAADRGGLLRTQVELENVSNTDETASSTTTDASDGTSLAAEEAAYDYYAAKAAGPCPCPAGGCPQVVGALLFPQRSDFQKKLSSVLRDIAGKHAQAAIATDPPSVSWGTNASTRSPYPGLFNVPPGYCFGIAFFQKAWLGGLISIVPHNPETVASLTEPEFLERVLGPLSLYLQRDTLAPRPIDVRTSNVWQLMNVLHDMQTGARASTRRDQSLLGTNSDAEIQEKLAVLLDPHGAEVFSMAEVRSPGPAGERPPRAGHAIVVYRGRDGGTYVVDGDAVSPLQTQRGTDRNYLCWDSFELVPPTPPMNPRPGRRTVETCTLELYTVSMPRVVE